jgi:hypothetical protein
MVDAAVEASEFWPKGFKKVCPAILKLKRDQVFTIQETLTTSRRGRGRGFMYVDSVDLALQSIAASHGLECKAATLTGND